MGSDGAAGFVESLEAYFGPWRGAGVKNEITKWIRNRGVPTPVLRDAYRRLRDTRKIEPVNTISIVDVWDAIDSCRSSAAPLAIDAPDYIKDAERKEVARFLRDLCDGLCDNTKRIELLKQREES